MRDKFEYNFKTFFTQYILLSFEYDCAIIEGTVTIIIPETQFTAEPSIQNALSERHDQKLLVKDH